MGRRRNVARIGRATNLTQTTAGITASGTGVKNDFDTAEKVVRAAIAELK